MPDSGPRDKTRVSRMHTWLKAVSRRWPVAPDAESRRRALTTVLFCVSMTFWAVVFAPVYLLLGSARGAIIIAIAGASCLSTVLMLTACGWIQLASNFIAAIVLTTLVTLSVFSGGMEAPAMVWLPSVPIIAILLCGWHTGRWWLLATLAFGCLIYYLDRIVAVLPASDFTEPGTERLFFLSLLGIIMCTTLLCFIFDFNSRVLQSQLEVARIAAEQGSRAKSEFVALMSHEIRTPMNGVLGMLELLGNTEITKWQREYVSLAKQSADSLLRLLNDILDFSKIEAGKMELEAIPFLLRDVIGDTLQALEFQAAEKKLELACQILPDVPDALVGDPGRLRQIIVNLAGNALKFTEHGEIVVRVANESQADGRATLHFFVTDTGVGIPKEKQQRIFDAFGQADSSTTRKFGGTGLGLNISQRLIEMMGGQLGLMSVEGGGTTFEFTLTVPVDMEASPLTEPATASLRDVRVLVVDDNATSRAILQEMLLDWKMQVTCVGSAKEALQVLDRCSSKSEQTDVILVDSVMPDVDGWMLAGQILSDSRLHEIPLIMLSSSGSNVPRDRHEALGISGRLRKPVKRSELLQEILHSLDRTRGAVDLKPVSRETLQTGQRLRILVAEDGVVNQKVARGLLEGQGHDVTIAANGKAAVEAAAHEHFDLILMDVEMPQMDGLEAAAVIREKERSSSRRTPIVAMTAHALKGDRERFLAAGMNDYIPKPIDPRHLRQVIARLTSAGALN